MTSKMIPFKILDCAFVAFTLTLLLAVVGLPLDVVFDLVDLSSDEFEGCALVMLFGLLALIHAIAWSDSAP